ncbi:MAG TPA: hypothetical protein DHN29_20220 [Cytophagales bacterium]|nr:hypothetical protein [Cytophagales bacterium]
MDQKLNYLLFTLVLIGAVSLSQAQSITSIIYDAETKEALPFCTVGIAGKSSGTVANSEGKFILGQTSFESGDTLVISHIGYEQYKQPVELVPSEVYIKSVSIALNEVSVFSRELKAKDIIEKIQENFETNHPTADEKQRIFLHEFERAKIPGKNRITVNESDFEGLDVSTIQSLIDRLPSEFVEYKDLIVEMYYQDNKSKLVPIEAISLEEQSMMDLAEEMEEQFEDFGENIKESVKNEDQYFKFQTGILSFKADIDTADQESAPDTLQYQNDTDYWKTSVKGYQKRYAHINSDYWEFITKPGKYRYTKGEVTIINDELVYQVSFKPKSGGLFEGVIYCSTSTYGVLQVDYKYATGKSDENFQLLGIGHSIEDIGARVMYEHTKDGYMLKYINAYEVENASIDRSFTFKRKEKRFMWDKTLNRLNIDLAMAFSIKSQMELLVLDRSGLDEPAFESIKQPEKFTFRKEISNSPDIWNNQTVLAPTNELSKYQRVDSKD